MINENFRQTRGLAILAMGSQIHRLDSSTYKVNSQSGNGAYTVTKNGHNWSCTCPDFETRRVVCKHIYAVEFSLSLRKRVFTNKTEVEDVWKPVSCKYCGSSSIIKRGMRESRGETVQRYSCKECGRRFVVKDGFEGMKNRAEIITLALDLYFKGISLRKITDHLKQFHSVEISHVAILKWIRKYVGIMKKYLDQLPPQVSEVWHTDEMKVSIRGEWRWLWNLMDHETRFLLASEVSKRRKIADARRIFAKGKAVAQDVPSFMVTDGLQAYTKAFKKEFYTLKKPRVQHIRKPRFVDPANNNMVERLNSTIREREKVMRSLKNNNSEIVDGFRIYYNFIRPHMALDGKTPAEVAGIKLKLGKNKWKSLIEQSLMNTKSKRAIIQPLISTKD